MGPFSLILAAALAAGSSPTADQLLIEFLREVCLSDVDRVEAVRRIARPGWRTSGPQIERDITWSVDAPTIRHDKIDQIWSIPVQGGNVRIHAWKFDFAPAEQTDPSSAIIWLRPDTLVDTASIATSLGLTLRPNGPVRRTPNQLTIISSGRVTRTAPPTGWLQHYFVEGARTTSPVEIAAMRQWGEGHPERVWRVTCYPRSR